MSGPRAGVAGWPVAHSLSPVIHGLWLKAAGIAGDYVLTPTEDLAGAIPRLRAQGFKGVNVTVPHKEAALALADRADEAARAAGAANLLLFHDDGTEARNTDGAGLLAALADQAPGLSVRGAAVVILGAGGAARGAAAALSEAGAEELRIVNRSVERAEALAAAFGGRAFAWAEAERAIAGADLVVNATTRGLGGEGPLRLAWPAPRRGAAAMDMVYRPLETAFLADARAAGWAAVDGLAMLIGQARPSFEAFFGRPPPEGVDVRAACLAALGARA